MYSDIVVIERHWWERCPALAGRCSWELPKIFPDFVNSCDLGVVDPGGRSMRPMGLFDLPDHLGASNNHAL